MQQRRYINCTGTKNEPSIKSKYQPETIKSGQNQTIEHILVILVTKIKTYNEEFDPGSGWTLATGLTHASRGVFKSLLLTTTGARVSNAYPTCPSHWDSLSKERLIPNNIVKLPDSTMKAFCGEGWGCVPLGSRRGNGPPSLRWIGVLRGRSPTLELRHGPNSYGRQQWGILVNGRKSEPAK